MGRSVEGFYRVYLPVGGEATSRKCDSLDRGSPEGMITRFRVGRLGRG